MKNAALVLVPGGPSSLAPASSRPLVDSFLSGRSPRTLEAYRADLQDFSRYIGAKNTDEAAAASASLRSASFGSWPGAV